eukprot:gene11867-2415_t
MPQQVLLPIWHVIAMFNLKEWRNEISQRKLRDKVVKPHLQSRNNENLVVMRVHVCLKSMPRQSAAKKREARLPQLLAYTFESNSHGFDSQIRWPDSKTRFDGQIRWPDSMARFDGQIRWPDSKTRFDGQIRWPDSKTRFDGQIRWPDSMAGFDGQIRWPDSMARFDGQIRWPDSMASNYSSMVISPDLSGYWQIALTILRNNT